ncbi:MAG: FAD-dependent oxidoreductase [Alphaproteobacteria bacterium]|nr:MAG: FAD-dependent oxidoreductase [Alphaproteobacteria bacterium]
MERPQSISTMTRLVRRSPGTDAHSVLGDICVLGAGIAGVSAALEAARLGRRVVLVDALPALGGQVNLTHVQTPLEPLAASRNALLGKAQADLLVLHFLQSEFPEAFGSARVRSYGLPGIRQTRWIVGRQQLTVDDVRRGTNFADAIARTSWPIELHDRPEGYLWEAFPDDHVHYVPFGSLVPAEAANLVAVGRCIDGDSAALSSVRVMGPCIAMGAAAAHALDLAGSGSVAQIDVAALRRRVHDNVE